MISSKLSPSILEIYFVVDTNLSFCLSTADHRRFNPDQSSTFRINGQTYTLSYGSGSLSVVLGYDTVTVSDVLIAPEGLWFACFPEP